MSDSDAGEIQESQSLGLGCVKEDRKRDGEVYVQTFLLKTGMASVGGLHMYALRRKEMLVDHPRPAH